MVILKNVTKTYDGKKNAVDNLNLEIKAGEIFGLLGPNGAGKTTALKMITGVLQPTRGDIFIRGSSILSEPLQAKKQFSFVSDDPNIFLRFKGIEYLKFMADIYGVDTSVREERVKKLAKEYAMSDVLNDPISSYSHGMRQKIVLIGALIHEPPIWILDEPMTGLDPRSSFNLKNRMREHADSNQTVLFSTHVLEVAEKVCDRVGIIDKGKLIFVGTIKEMRDHFKENASLEEMFLELTDETFHLPEEE
ncbi:MAG TPA: ABC transporter ATP-binding protein [Clostridiaceae bacterium]|nr:ABC transporter ATP-binding protein [Clostridiaceae bacterium]